VNEGKIVTEEMPRAADVSALEPNKSRAIVDLIKVLATHPEHADYLRQLVAAETQRDAFDQDYRTAKVFALSGRFDDIKGSTPEQAVATAMAKIRIGREWGMNDSDSIAFIYFVNGRPAVMTEIMATKIQQAGFHWDIEWHTRDELYKGKTLPRCVGCTLWLKQLSRETNRYEPVLDRKGDPVSASFTEMDAEAGKLLDKAVWKAYSQDMYFWRALSRLRKYHLTSVMRGAVQMELAGDDLPAPEIRKQIDSPKPEAVEPPRKPLRERILEHDKEATE